MSTSISLRLDNLRVKVIDRFSHSLKSGKFDSISSCKDDLRSSLFPDYLTKILISVHHLYMSRELKTIKSVNTDG